MALTAAHHNVPPLYVTITYVSTSGAMPLSSIAERHAFAAFWLLARRTPRRGATSVPEPDHLSSSRHAALAFCLSKIFSENRLPLFGIML
jgi:hypothetical protein